MKYPFKTKEQEIKKYLFELKEVCIIEHEDNWFKEKSHTKLYPNLEEAKSKVASENLDEIKAATERLQNAAHAVAGLAAAAAGSLTWGRQQVGH